MLWRCAEHGEWRKILSGMQQGDCMMKCPECHKNDLEQLKFLERLSEILHTFHSEIPLVEIGRQNVHDDIANELELDERIEMLKKKVKNEA